MDLEVYDECALTMDELIAYGRIQIPRPVFQYESVDAWFKLSGKQGEDKEGSIHLMFTLLVKQSPFISSISYEVLIFINVALI